MSGAAAQAEQTLAAWERLALDANRWLPYCVLIGGGAAVVVALAALASLIESVMVLFFKE